MTVYWFARSYEDVAPDSLNSHAYESNIYINVYIF